MSIDEGSSSLLVGSGWPRTSRSCARPPTMRRASSGAGGRRRSACLTPSEAATIDAISAQIIPTDDTPGAREAGAVYFIDHALATFAKADFPKTRAGLKDLGARVVKTYPGSSSFEALSSEQQHAAVGRTRTGEKRVLRADTRRRHCGPFAGPDYGGNRDKIGWQLLGFDESVRLGAALRLLRSGIVTMTHHPIQAARPVVKGVTYRPARSRGLRRHRRRRGRRRRGARAGARWFLGCRARAGTVAHRARLQARRAVGVQKIGVDQRPRAVARTRSARTTRRAPGRGRP